MTRTAIAWTTAGAVIIATVAVVAVNSATGGAVMISIAAAFVACVAFVVAGIIMDLDRPYP